MLPPLLFVAVGCQVTSHSNKSERNVSSIIFTSRVGYQGSRTAGWSLTTYWKINQKIYQTWTSNYTVLLVVYELYEWVLGWYGISSICEMHTRIRLWDSESMGKISVSLSPSLSPSLPMGNIAPYLFHMTPFSIGLWWSATPLLRFRENRIHQHNKPSCSTATTPTVYGGS